MRSPLDPRRTETPCSSRRATHHDLVTGDARDLLQVRIVHASRTPRCRVPLGPLIETTPSSRVWRVVLTSPVGATTRILAMLTTPSDEGGAV